MMKPMEKVLNFLKSITGRGAEGRLSFTAMFARFRQVLDNHNRAAEIIADMGDKLGGEYIFDINYIKSAYAELHRRLSVSLSDFDVLTRHRYARIGEVFDRIDGEIRRLVYDEGAASGDLVVFYGDITWSMAREVGGKNANLADLKNNLHVNVPDAFAVTTHAFDAFMKQNGIDAKIAALAPDKGIGEKELREIRDAIDAGALPPALENALSSALAKIGTGCGRDCFIAVRSSAEDEDGRHSFAGQFETVLNVPLDLGKVGAAYKKVIAGLFSDKACAYLLQSGYHIGNMKMAAACVLMVDAEASGVVYSTDPGGSGDTLMINATWGLGRSVVEGQTDADFYSVKKGSGAEIAETRIGQKASLITGRKSGGTSTVPTSADRKAKEALTKTQILELSERALQIEKYFRQPQDIEWAVDGAGKLFILQSRPLRARDEQGPAAGPAPGAPDSKILMRARGFAVQKGSGAGRAFVLKNRNDLDGFPKGAVLIARNDSSDFIRVMPYAAAIITDIGTPTSHMASLCREFRVPAIVNAGNASGILKHGQEITVNIDDENSVTVYEGIARGILEHAGRKTSVSMEDIYEFRKKRYVLRFISPLNLIDPLLDNFSPEGCKTMHDILRFIHEKSVVELVESARYGLKGHAAVKLDLPIPAGIMAVDIGGGLDAAAGRKGKDGTLAFEHILSIPLKAVLKGMMHPGVWHSEAVSLRAQDFLSSMMRMPDIASANDDFVEHNVAIVSREYMHLSLRFGYHFNMLDCYCSENTRDNHIYFRFTGGATDMTKRSRRIQLIAIILKEYGFNIRVKGDLIIGRLSNIRQDDMEATLDRIGRLIGYTRQLDALLHDDNRVEQYARNFLQEDYTL